jgi:uncharacterized membrane protein YdjX (TVP38/TMEM64 family)
MIIFLIFQDKIISKLYEYKVTIHNYPISSLLILFSIDTLGSILLIPGAIFAISAGLIFGTFASSGVFDIFLFIGGVFIFLNIQAIAGLVVFNFSKACLRKRIRSTLIETNEKWLRFDKLITIYGTKALFLIRLSPLIPISLFNYICGGFNSIICYLYSQQLDFLYICLWLVSWRNILLLFRLSCYQS